MYWNKQTSVGVDLFKRKINGGYVGGYFFDVDFEGVVFFTDVEVVFSLVIPRIESNNNKHI